MMMDSALDPFDNLFNTAPMQSSLDPFLLDERVQLNEFDFDPSSFSPTSATIDNPGSLIAGSLRAMHRPRSFRNEFRY